MARLVFDIETVGDEFDTMDGMTQHYVLKRLGPERPDDSDWCRQRDNVVDLLSINPLTGQIASIGALDEGEDSGTVWYQAPGQKYEDIILDNGLTLVQMDERGILVAFFEAVAASGGTISYFGEGFDVPFILARALIRGVLPAEVVEQLEGESHFDLFKALNSRFLPKNAKGSLHLWCRAFGIETPKKEGSQSDDVGKLWKAGEFVEIATYNGRDCFATREVYWEAKRRNAF
jgi:DNA polymerase elongation subunit (family B)